jgi:PleD family two-component response regulator
VQGLEQGSELIVRLPRVQAPADEASPHVQASVSVDTKTRKRVLVVDDNRDAASSLRSLIEMLGHEVREVTTALMLSTSRGVLIRS